MISTGDTQITRDHQGTGGGKGRMPKTKAVGRYFWLGGPSAEGVRTVQVGPGACSPGNFFISDSLKLVFLHFGVSFSL